MLFYYRIRRWYSFLQKSAVDYGHFIFNGDTSRACGSKRISMACLFSAALFSLHDIWMTSYWPCVSILSQASLRKASTIPVSFLTLPQRLLCISVISLLSPSSPIHLIFCHVYSSEWQFILHIVKLRRRSQVVSQCLFIFVTGTFFFFNGPYHIIYA